MEEAVKKPKTGWYVLFIILFFLLFLVAAAISGLGFYYRAAGDSPDLFGYRVYAPADMAGGEVAPGSMVIAHNAVYQEVRKNQCVIYRDTEAYHLKYVLSVMEPDALYPRGGFVLSNADGSARIEASPESVTSRALTFIPIAGRVLSAAYTRLGAVLMAASSLLFLVIMISLWVRCSIRRKRYKKAAWESSNSKTAYMEPVTVHVSHEAPTAEVGIYSSPASYVCDIRLELLGSAAELQTIERLINAVAEKLGYAASTKYMYSDEGNDRLCVSCDRHSVIKIARIINEVKEKYSGYPAEVDSGINQDE